MTVVLDSCTDGSAAITAGFAAADRRFSALEVGFRSAGASRAAGVRAAGIGGPAGGRRANAGHRRPGPGGPGSPTPTPIPRCRRTGWCASWSSPRPGPTPCWGPWNRIPPGWTRNCSAAGWSAIPSRKTTRTSTVPTSGSGRRPTWPPGGFPAGIPRGPDPGPEPAQPRLHRHGNGQHPGAHLGPDPGPGAPRLRRLPPDSRPARARRCRPRRGSDRPPPGAGVRCSTQYEEENVGSSSDTAGDTTRAGGWCQAGSQDRPWSTGWPMMAGMCWRCRAAGSGAATCAM